MSSISGFTGSGDSCEGHRYTGLFPAGEAVLVAPSDVAAADVEGPGLKSLPCAFGAWVAALGLEGSGIIGLEAAAEAAGNALVLVEGPGMTGLLAASDEAGAA